MQRACRTLHGLVNQEESGLGDAPLSTAAAKLLATSPAEEIAKIALLATNRAVADVVLASLLQGAPALPLASAFEKWQTNCIEITMHGLQYSLSCGAKVREFSSLETFLAAMDEGLPEGQGSGQFNPLRLGIPARPGATPLKVLLPARLQTLHKQARLLSYLADEAQFLVLAGAPEETLDLDVKKALDDLAADISSFQAVVVSDDAAGKLPPWMQLRSSFVFPAVILSPLPPHAILKGKLLLAEEFRLIRELVSQHGMARRAEILISLARQKASQEMELCQRKKQMRESSAQAITADDGQVKKAVERVMARLSEQLKTLSVDLDDATRKAFFTEGAVHTFIYGNGRTFTLMDVILTDKEASSTIVLREDLANYLHEESRQALDDYLSLENEMVHDGVAAATDEASEGLSTILGSPVQLEQPSLDEARFNAFKEIALRNKISFSSEIPRPTKLEVFMSTMQAPVMIFMAITMPIQMFFPSGLGAMSEGLGKLGNYGRFLRACVGLILGIPLYVYFTKHSLRKFKLQREAALNKELTRIRTMIETDRDKLFHLVLDERRKQFGEYFSRCMESLRKQLDGLMADYTRRRDQKRVLETKDTTAQVQLLDRRLRDYTGRLQQYEGLGRELDQGKRTLETSFQSMISALKV